MAITYGQRFFPTCYGVQFTNQARHKYAFHHIFDRVRDEKGIEHRLTKLKHPSTTDVIDKSFFDKSALFSCRARTTAWRRAGSEVRVLPRSFYRRTSFAASVRAFLWPRGFQPATKRA